VNWDYALNTSADIATEALHLFLQNAQGKLLLLMWRLFVVSLDFFVSLFLVKLVRIIFASHVLVGKPFHRA